MKSSSSADRLIHGIYATVLDDTPWEELFPQLIQGFSGYAGNLFTPFVRDRSQGGLDLAHGFPHEAVQRYLTEGADVDVWYFELLRRHGVDGVLPTGLAYNSRSLLPTSQLHRSRFFADYLQPFDIGDSLGAIVGNGSRETLPVAALCVFRDLAAKPFEDQDLAKLQRPQRHFTSALELRMRMCRTMVDAVSRTFDLLTDAVAVMALDATVLLTNAAADRLLAKRQYPQVRFGRLRAQAPEHTAHLEQALKDCANCRMGAPESFVVRLAGQAGSGVIAHLIPPPARWPVGPRAAAIAFLRLEGQRVTSVGDILPCMDCRRPKWRWSSR